MAKDMNVPRSRRALLAGAAGSAAGLAAARLAGPEAALAASMPVLLNEDNPATAMTSITGNGINAFKVTTGTQATAIWGYSGSGVGVYAQADSGWGLTANSNTGTAINATSASGISLDSSSASNTAVRGWSGSGAGVLGHVGNATPAPAAGVALVGSVSDKSQVGIRASGRAQLPDRSGRVTVGAGKAYADVDLRTRGGLSGTPLCFANLMTYRSGTYVTAVRPNYPSSGKLRIYLNKAVTSSTYVAWVVLN